MKHRATGNRRGRPRTASAGLRKRLIDLLKKRADENNGLAKTDWRGLEKELGVSRSTIARELYSLRLGGIIKRVDVEVSPHNFAPFYRINLG